MRHLVNGRALAPRGAVLGAGILAALLPGCASLPVAPPPPAAQAVADPQDSCGPQVVVFVNAADLFGSPPRRSGPPSAAELAAELARENAALERLQIAFDALLYCRWTEVRVIRAEAASGGLPPAELPRRLQAADGRLRQDVRRAEQSRQRIAARAARIEQAVEAAAPGTRAAVAAGRAEDPGRPRAVASASIVLRARPEGDAPVVARLEAGSQVRLREAAGGFVQADGGPDRRGYAPGTAFTLQPALPEPEADGVARLRSLAATNIARRDAFAQSVELASRSGLQGFEPAS
ncbi:SH3 domain-containing protein [Falsiroseomonas selenitidurans]|uniref:SH3b domain-containing protein n=1 Tax=Falsiroseomonas selenitidurans TaxID=2716335 RepID=A0ABX1E1I1_9PROT|nr:hypothetical protein [Falsiroseomonas selenitidurans]NKC31014.1 hypothetical protein [Falsiroseomonas selenitidurans]